MRDPYTVLGVGRSASEADIKKAYRRLAKTWHPDRNKDDPKARDKFSEINNAYEIIGDADKRKKFDAGEIDAEGKPRFTGFEGFGPGAGARGGSRGGFEGFNFGFGGDGGFRSARGARASTRATSSRISSAARPPAAAASAARGAARTCAARRRSPCRRPSRARPCA